MNNLTRWESYSPVSIGMESLFNRLDTFADNASVNYPPYNIVSTGDNTQELHIALAGFTKEEIEVSTERSVLSVRANKKEETDLTYVHRGIAKRSVNRNWQLSDDTVVDSVSYENGLLVISLRRELPEAQRRRVLEIN